MSCSEEEESDISRPLCNNNDNEEHPKEKSDRDKTTEGENVE